MFGSARKKLLCVVIVSEVKVDFFHFFSNSFPFSISPYLVPAIQIQKLEKGSDCRAVLDSQGRKRCPHGVRVTKEGRKEYCRNPVDC